MGALLDSIDDIATKAWREVMNAEQTADFVAVPDAPRPSETYIPQVCELPYFRFLKWMTVRALKRIDENIDLIRPGSRGCIIQTAYNVVADAITGPRDAVRLAKGDWDWNRRNLQTAKVFGNGPRESPTKWLPDTFDSSDAASSSQAMMSWNDSGIYDNEKRALLHLAVDQEFARRGATPPCGKNPHAEAF